MGQTGYARRADACDHVCSLAKVDMQALMKGSSVDPNSGKQVLIIASMTVP
jgi:hypothetical protein